MTPSVETPAQTAPWDIESVQHRLAELGYDAGEADGLLGPKTRAALRSFQGDRGLPITGLPDGDTQRALFAAKPPHSERAARPPSDDPPSDDPPSLDAVPLGPVEVAPLAPMVAVTPHEGLSAAQFSDEPAGEASLAAEPDRGSQASRGDWLSVLGSWDTRLDLAALALGALGAISLLAATILKWAKRKAAVAERRRSQVDSRAAAPHPAAGAAASAAASQIAAASKTVAASTTARGAHVFGVDVPPSGDPETG